MPRTKKPSKTVKLVVPLKTPTMAEAVIAHAKALRGLAGALVDLPELAAKAGKALAQAFIDHTATAAGKFSSLLRDVVHDGVVDALVGYGLVDEKDIEEAEKKAPALGSVPPEPETAQTRGTQV